jgi:hypothetical protein
MYQPLFMYMDYGVLRNPREVVEKYENPAKVYLQQDQEASTDSL